MPNYLFIDGAYLHKNFGSQMQAFYGLVPQIDFQILAGSLEAERTYYYDAIDYTKASGEGQAEYDTRISEKEALHDYIHSQPGFHVREGHVRRSSRRRNREQKTVDVQLAVDALEHAARGNMTLAILFTGDLDFEPLLASLERLGVRTRLIYFPLHTSKELTRAADEIRKVTLEHLHNWAAASFRQNYQRVTLNYGKPPPDPVPYKPVREGTWNKRKVTLFNHSHPEQAAPRLYVEPGNELTEPSYLMTHVDIDKLSKAFELTFGKIQW